MSLTPTNQTCCTACVMRQGGVCGEDGASIESHVTAGYCPIGVYRRMQHREPRGQPFVPFDDSPPIRFGPGTELIKLLGRLGIKPDANCPCKANAAKMNRWGCDECDRRMDEIVGWLAAEAKRRRLPFIAAAGRMLVRRAIRNARRPKPPPRS